MFGALTQNNTLYVLDKSDGEPKLKVATIETTTAPTGFSTWMQGVVGQTVDLSVVYSDGTKSKFEKLPAGNSVYSYEKATVTETRELMQQQIEAAVRTSKSILDSVPYHQKAIGLYEGFLKQLSPTYAKEKETDERLSSLEKGLGDIKSILMKMSSNSSSKNKD